jgi:dephospho-CoA kinase
MPTKRIRTLKSEGSRPRFRQIAVTGGIGCGKSAVADILRKYRISTLDADDVARGMLTTTHPVGRRVIRAFGTKILNPDGTVNRAELADLVFRNETERNRLNQILHPAILRACREWMAARKNRRIAVVLPLLHELNLDTGWDAILCVTALRETAIRRLRSRGWTRSESIRRMRAQLPLKEKAARSTHVIRNNGTLRELEMTIRTALGLTQEGKRP